MNVPKLRFKEFSSEWTSKNLEDITKEKISYGIVQAGAHVEDGVPYIKSSNVGGRIELSELQRTSQAIHYKYRRSAVHPNDIVFSLRGNIGQVSIVPEIILEANLTQGTARISVNDTNNTLFIYFQLQTNIAFNRIKECSKGSTFKEIPLNELRKISILVCTGEEQTKIANFLTAIDEKITQLTQNYDLLKQYKKGVMQQIFSQKLRFKDEDGREFPEWLEKKLGNVGRVSMCKRILKEQTKPLGDVPFYKIGTFGKKTDAYISNEIYESYKRKFSFPKKGDILLSAAGTIGRAVIYDGLAAYFQDSNIVWIDNNEELVTNSFLYFIYANVKWNTENTTIARLYNENLRSLSILVPSLPEQTKIAHFLTAIDDKITHTQTQLDALKNYKKGLLQQLFV